MKELDDLLIHYGVKGMKWGVRRSEEEISAAESEGGGGGDPEEDSALEEFFDGLVEDVKDTVVEVGKNLSKLDDVIKEFGSKTLKSIFGEAKNKTTMTTYINGQDVEELKKKQKPAKGSSEWYEERLKKETPKQTRDRLKKEWENVPPARFRDL